ncbi:hypothetical protein [uncultured Brachyspira sp.]|uniref:hypothetical protein n=1 Tax=uncultured Brachyspira sp. TaxID=221953 RepID=UPI00259B59C1|nr:hypothetical protein [uncultured Brachyspira sp.]
MGVVTYSSVSSSLDKISLNNASITGYIYTDLGGKDGGIAVPNMGDSQVNYVYIATKRAILKGKTITIYDEQGSKIDRTITFNDDNSIATYTYKGKTTEFKRD